jgi:hypothetical protein
MDIEVISDYVVFIDNQVSMNIFKQAFEDPHTLASLGFTNDHDFQEMVPVYNPSFRSETSLTNT